MIISAVTRAYSIPLSFLGEKQTRHSLFLRNSLFLRPERKFLNLAHYFPYDLKLRLLAHSRSFLANQKARNAIVGTENLLKADKPRGMLVEHKKNS